MGGLTTSFRSLWLIGAVLTVAAGLLAFIVESAIKPGRACTTGNPSHGILYFVIFLALAVLPGAAVGLFGWRSGRSGEETVGPFVATLVGSVTLVFIGLLTAWGGHGCIT